jgi:hypothetical protein
MLGQSNGMIDSWFMKCYEMVITVIIQSALVHIAVEVPNGTRVTSALDNLCRLEIPKDVG